MRRIYLSLVLIPLVLFNSSIRSQSLNIDVQGDIYEYATYYVSSFDIATGGTNVQIFNYSLQSSTYPVYIKINFKATLLSPGLGITSEATIVEVETEPFLIQDDLYLDNRDLSSAATIISDNSGNQIELQGQLIDVLDPGLSETIMQNMITSGKLSDGQYTFSVKIFGGFNDNDMSLVFDDSKTFVIQSQVPITLETPGGSLADTTENLLDRIKTKKIIFKVKEIKKISEEKINGIKFSYNSNNEIIVLYERKKHKIDQIINNIKNAGMEIYDISTDEGDLEDVFIDLTKE